MRAEDVELYGRIEEKIAKCYMHLDENSHRLLAEALAEYIAEWRPWG